MGEVVLNGGMICGFAMFGDAVLACCIAGVRRIDTASGNSLGCEIWYGCIVFLYHVVCAFVFRGSLVSWSYQLVIVSRVGLVVLVFGVSIGLVSLVT